MVHFFAFTTLLFSHQSLRSIPNKYPFGLYALFSIYSSYLGVLLLLPHYLSEP